MKKIYRVLIEWSDGADVLIRAENADEAGRIAVALMDNGTASYELDQSNASEYHAKDVEEVEQPDARDIAHAEANESEAAENEI